MQRMAEEPGLPKGTHLPLLRVCTYIHRVDCLPSSRCLTHLLPCLAACPPRSWREQAAVSPGAF